MKQQRQSGLLVPRVVGGDIVGISGQANHFASVVSFLTILSMVTLLSHACEK